MHEALDPQGLERTGLQSAVTLLISSQCVRSRGGDPGSQRGVPLALL